MFWYTVRVTNTATGADYPETVSSLREATARGKWYRSTRAQTHSYEIINPEGEVLERYSWEDGLRRNYAG